MQKVLVTGGAGFIGSNLALELERLGKEVVVIDNFHSADRANLKGFHGRILNADVSDSLPFSEPFDILFHQAAITDPRYHNNEELYQKNVKGFENVLQLAKAHGARVVYASTAGLYGNGPIPMQEDQPKEILTPYGQSKLKMDEVAQTLQSEMAIVGLRYFNVFGPREAHKGRPASMVLHLARQMESGKRPRIFNYGEQVRDFIYVKDAVGANLAAMSAPSGIYNVGTGIGTSFNQLVQTLNAVLGTELAPEYFPMPYDPKTYQHNTVADTQRASRELGFTYRWPLKEAIEDYLSWLGSST